MSRGLTEELRERLQGLGYQPAADEAEDCALRLALRRAGAYLQDFCRLPEAEPLLGPADLEGVAEPVDCGGDFWPVNWPEPLREVELELAAANFLQARLALTPETLAVMPIVTSIRLGDAALGFAGGSQAKGTDALSRAETLCRELAQRARAALCSWRGVVW